MQCGFPKRCQSGIDLIMKLIPWAVMLCCTCADRLCPGVSAFNVKWKINNSLLFPPLVLSPASLNNGCVQRIHFTVGASVSFLLYVFTTRRLREMEILQHPSCDLHQASKPGYGDHPPLWFFFLVLNTFQDKGMVYDGRESEEICLCVSLLCATVFLFGWMAQS
jgi:hypothetical protein